MLLLDFINVGYGDSILIRELQQDETVYTLLVDCGDTKMAAHYEHHRICVCDYLKKAGVFRIDTLLITHLHKDHIGGLAQVAAFFPVQQIISSYYPPSNAKTLSGKAGNLLSGSRPQIVMMLMHVVPLAASSLHQEGDQHTPQFFRGPEFRQPAYEAPLISCLPRYPPRAPLSSSSITLHISLTPFGLSFK